MINYDNIIVIGIEQFPSNNALKYILLWLLSRIDFQRDSIMFITPMVPFAKMDWC